ncbi:Conserved_hypothetical protein [Hexamita inflata]|uniref:Uncharacterized protein n=1 Tax=Hexamita inflata TaxID=28002 RepID=A0AA86R4I7_9EUKA|nr:Conserved hypothetical protein [Hexamita inflata]CAI9935283.1 Conserved hypothetical protein [Hexamita inflata]CAI9971549.1 Conserved hypothetical protein [Hexamita inflata]
MQPSAPAMPQQQAMQAQPQQYMQYMQYAGMPYGYGMMPMGGAMPGLETPKVEQPKCECKCEKCKCEDVRIKMQDKVVEEMTKLRAEIFASEKKAWEAYGKSKGFM